MPSCYVMCTILYLLSAAHPPCSLVRSISFANMGNAANQWCGCRQEKVKDPTERYESFLQKKEGARGAPVTSCFGNTSTSGSFGGRPRQVRKAKKGAKSAPPAWLRGGEGEGEGEG